MGVFCSKYEIFCLKKQKYFIEAIARYGRSNENTVDPTGYIHWRFAHC
jgi:hypothetical protein